MKVTQENLFSLIPYFGWYPVIKYLVRNLRRGDEVWCFMSWGEIEAHPDLTKAEREDCRQRFQEGSHKAVLLVRQVVRKVRTVTS